MEFDLELRRRYTSIYIPTWPHAQSAGAVEYTDYTSAER